MGKKDMSTQSPRAKVRLRAAVYVEKDGCVLLVHDPVYLGGCWILPGGGVELDEPIVHAAEREVFEETGINIAVKGLLAMREIWEPENDIPSRKDLIRRSIEFFFRGEYESGSIDITNNPSTTFDGIPRIKHCKWFNLSDLGDSINGVPLYPPELFKKKMNEIPIDNIFLATTDLRGK